MAGLNRASSASSFSALLTERINNVANNVDFDGRVPAMVQSIFNTTTCYDLMQASSKAIVFEVQIPFQLAFYAMVENEAEVAPIWDPDRRIFVGLLTTYDYINALRICLTRGITVEDLSLKTIGEIMSSTVFTLRHPYFDPLDPDDTIFQLCRLLYTSQSEFTPVVDPETGSLVTILGYLDIVHLVDNASRQFPNIFTDTLESLNIVISSSQGGPMPLTLNRSMALSQVLSLFESHKINGAPVIDDTGRVINYYHKSDVSFILKAPDTDSNATLTNLRDLTIGEILAIREQLAASGEAVLSTQGLVTCSITDQVNVILNAMMEFRVTKVVVVDQAFSCVGVVSIKDILSYYLTNGSLP